MLLSEIPKNVNCIKVYNFKDQSRKFNFLSTNSKNVKKNSIFFINKKNNFKKKYIYEAIEKGAVAIITNYYFRSINIPQFLVRDIDTSLLLLLKRMKKIPPQNIIGITGTNGKTSVVWIITNILNKLKIKTKMYGTLGYYKNLIKKEDNDLTTPEYEILYQSAFSKTSVNKYQYIFEVSSHSISKKRINNFPINIAAITNITQDHLDFHKNIINYRKAKFNFFLKNLNDNGIAILNDNIYGIKKIKKKLINRNIKILSYGSINSDIHYYIKNKKIFLKVFNSKYLLKIKGYRNFELDNLSCAIACCISIGTKIRDIIKILNTIKKPEGRLEEAGTLNDNSKIIVDYAHTPDALKNILLANTINKIKPNIVFGCGGNRDKSKRKKMGLIANKYANKVYITDDNPRKEDPKLIRQSIMKGCVKGIEIDNRRVAIKTSINQLSGKRILIIAGKGHEKIQVLKNKTIKFDDIKIAKFYINKRKNNDSKKI